MADKKTPSAADFRKADESYRSKSSGPAKKPGMKPMPYQKPKGEAKKPGMKPMPYQKPKDGSKKPGMKPMPLPITPNTKFKKQNLGAARKKG